jgi:hypothetical protein
MGKVKAMMMDMEEQFFDEALCVLKDGCECVEEFIAGCNRSKHLVAHMFSNDVEYIDYMSEMWSEYWSNLS